MINTVTLVGRIARDLEITENEEGKKVLTIVVAVSRHYKNINGEYETDFISVRVGQGLMLETTKENCLKGDIIGIRGRLAKLENENLKVIAEKITFMPSGKGEEI